MSIPLNRRDLLKLAALAPLLRWTWPQQVGDPARPTPASDKPNVLILLFDTFSARHASIYGYHRETTPNLARFAERATVYHRHTSAANFTSPATGSLMTGSYPWTHRSFNMRGTVSDPMVANNLFNAFGDEYHRAAYTHSSLAMLLLNQFQGALELLKPIEDLYLVDEVFSDRLFAKDVNTAMTSEQLILPKDGRLPTSLFLSLADSLERSLRIRSAERRFGNLFPRGFPTADKEARIFILEQAIDWLRETVPQLPQPFLMYVHLLPPHEPYHPRRDFLEHFEDGWRPLLKPQHLFSERFADDSLTQRRQAYDRFLAYADAEFGRLYDTLEQQGVLENSYVVFTSDHGQMFERGIHGHITPALFEPLQHIPLLISRPGQRQREDVHSRTSTVDLLPSLLHATGHPTPTWSEGQLLPGLGGEAATERSFFTVEAKNNRKFGPLNKATISLIKEEYKLVHYFGYNELPNGYELYNLGEDEEEMENLYPAAPAIAATLRDELAAKVAEVNASYATEV